MNTIKHIAIIPLVSLHPKASIGPTVRRPHSGEIPDLFRVVANVRKIQLVNAGIKEVNVPVMIDDFSSLDGAENFAARMLLAFPKIVRSGVSNIGETIRLAVAASFDVEVDCIQARSMKHESLKPRHATSYLARAIRSKRGDLAMTLTQAGKITARDRTTVMNSVRLVSILIDRRDRCRDYDDFVRRLSRAERALRCAGFGFQHDAELASKLGA